MSKYIPKELKGFILPFNWDVNKVWGLLAPIEDVELSDFEFLFELPFWSSRPNAGMLFDISPNQVLANMYLYPHQKERVEKADIQYPIDFIFENGTYYILDGLHRLARHKLLGNRTVKVRRHKLEIRTKIQVNKSL
ncbi:hypothetical protein [Motilimonas sp. KMU-193]|uniref:hypothetical protein n=1 Tax=Motilimonas sp. KMU-193 TaxID=3388668 RepID=UPI00396B1091